jgi:hypothetical protein
MAIQPQITAGGSRQRLLLLLAGVGAIGITLLLAGPLQHSRRAAEPAPATVARPVPTTTVPAQMTAPSTTLGTGGPGTAAATKDPFRPLVTPEAAGTATAAAAATPTAGQAVASTVPGAGTGTASTPGGGAVAAEHQVALVDIVTRSGARAARVEVDGTRYTVAEGDTFAGSYRAVDIGSSCATFESDSTPFTLCEGEAVLK